MAVNNSPWSKDNFNNSGKRSPCQLCTVRHLHCHSECYAYNDYKSLTQKTYDVIKEHRSKEQDVFSSIIRCKERVDKKKVGQI